MDTVVVDTDVMSYTIKGDTRAERYRGHLEGRLLVVSFQTVAELLTWTKRYDWSEKRVRALEDYLGGYIVRFPDWKTCDAWAKITSRGLRTGRKICPKDAWVAAVALQDNLALVTHNLKHFESIEGLVVISEPG